MILAKMISQKLKTSILKLISVGFFLTLLLSQTSFGPWPFNGFLNASSWSTREIIVLTKKNPLTFNDSRSVPSGIEYDLIQNFSTVTGFPIKWIVFKTEEDLLTAWKNGEGDLLAGRVLHEDFSKSNSEVGPIFEESALHLICHKNEMVESDGDLENKMVFIESSKIKEVDSKFFHPEGSIFWNEQNLPFIQLVKNTAKRKRTCVIGEYYEALSVLRKYPQLEFKFKISENRMHAWHLRNQNDDFKAALRTWMQIATRNQFIISTHFRYKSHLHELTLADYMRFFSEIKNTLPKFEDYFKSAGRRYNIPWQLIAAVAYQESKWNPEARSFTGVIGFMQITHETAQHLGLSDREDVEASIDAGARYLRKLIDNTPKNLPFKERLALALAAWNIGPGHLLDAQGLALSRQLNPNSWHELRSVLPLLSQEEFYKSLKFGRARGEEPVRFVDRVRNYYEVLSVSVN